MIEYFKTMLPREAFAWGIVAGIVLTNIMWLWFG